MPRLRFGGPFCSPFHSRKPPPREQETTRPIASLPPSRRRSARACQATVPRRRCKTARSIAAAAATSRPATQVQPIAATAPRVVGLATPTTTCARCASDAARASPSCSRRSSRRTTPRTPSVRRPTGMEAEVRAQAESLRLRILPREGAAPSAPRWKRTRAQPPLRRRKGTAAPSTAPPPLRHLLQQQERLTRSAKNDLRVNEPFRRRRRPQPLCPSGLLPPHNPRHQPLLLLGQAARSRCGARQLGSLSQHQLPRIHSSNVPRPASGPNRPLSSRTLPCLLQQLRHNHAPLARRIVMRGSLLACSTPDALHSLAAPALHLVSLPNSPSLPFTRLAAIQLLPIPVLSHT